VPAVETLLVPRWFRARLIADVTLTALVPASRIYHDRVPQNTAYPYVVYQFSGGSDTRNMYRLPVLVRTTFMIKAVHGDPANSAGATNYDVVEPIYRRLHELIDAMRFQPVYSGSPVAQVGYMHACWRESQIQYMPLVGDRYEAHLGGTYGVDVQAAA
jgi:hypothetical protein